MNHHRIGPPNEITKHYFGWHWRCSQCATHTVGVPYSTKTRAAKTLRAHKKRAHG